MRRDKKCRCADQAAEIAALKEQRDRLSRRVADLENFINYNAGRLADITQAMQDVTQPD